MTDVRFFSFTCTEWEETGLIGYKPDWWGKATPAMGLGVAHDVMEHLAGWGSFEQEMVAFGVMLHTRELGGYWRQRYYRPQTWAQAIPIDLDNLFSSHLEDEEQWIKPCTRVHENPVDRCSEADMEFAWDDISEMIQQNAEDMRVEEVNLSLTEDHRRAMFRCWRLGLRLGRKYYPDPVLAMDAFYAIRDKVDALLVGERIGEKLVIELHRKPETHVIIHAAEDYLPS